MVSVASDVSFSPDPNWVIPTAVSLTKAALEASAAEPSIKRFVHTSSSAACIYGRFNEVYEITPDTYNTKAVAESEEPGPYGPDRIFPNYAASKTKQEQYLWNFVKEKNLDFTVNTVLPDFTIGKVLSIEHQGYPSTAAFLKTIFEGDMQQALNLPPGHEIDVQDCARLHVAALLHPDVHSERVFAYAFPKNWTSTLQHFRELYPGRKFPDAPVGEGEDKSIITRRPRAEELLKWLGADGFTSYRDSIKALTDTLV
jgi:nucleoside-diphosphate-sugar epimerase